MLRKAEEPDSLAWGNNRAADWRTKKRKGKRAGEKRDKRVPSGAESERRRSKTEERKQGDTLRKAKQRHTREVEREGGKGSQNGRGRSQEQTYVETSSLSAVRVHSSAVL